MYAWDDVIDYKCFFKKWEKILNDNKWILYKSQIYNLFVCNLKDNLLIL